MSTRFPRQLVALTVLGALLLLVLILPSPLPAEGSGLPPAGAAEQGTTTQAEVDANTVPATPAPAAVAEDDLLQALQRQAPTLEPEVLARAVDALRCALAAGEVKRDDTLTVIDYSLPSTAKRLWVFDVERRELLFNELVAHGKNTGGNLATRFSNTQGSRQTSLGLFRTAGTYFGKNGYSLRLDGLEPGVNDRALPRTIVVHGAWYVSRDFAARHGRIGRSWGCPAVRKKVARPLIDAIKGGTLVFSYYPDPRWLRRSRFLAACGADDGAPAALLAAR